MPILTNETEPKRGRRSWIPALLVGVPLLLLAVLFLLALFVPLDDPIVVQLGGSKGPVLVGMDAQPPPGMPATHPRWQAFAYKRKVRSGITIEVHGVRMGHRLWSVEQLRR